jgi:hypothetical protein
MNAFERIRGAEWPYIVAAVPGQEKWVLILKECYSYKRTLYACFSVNVI